MKSSKWAPQEPEWDTQEQFPGLDCQIHSPGSSSFGTKEIILVPPAPSITHRASSTAASSSVSQTIPVPGSHSFASQPRSYRSGVNQLCFKRAKIAVISRFPSLPVPSRLPLAGGCVLPAFSWDLAALRGHRAPQAGADPCWSCFISINSDFLTEDFSASVH